MYIIMSATENRSSEDIKKEEIFLKFIKQFLIILGISFAGEALHFLLPFPIPASIYGMLLLLLGLLTKIIPLESVKEVGTFLVEIMPVMFIPAGVGLISSWNILHPIILPISIITVVTLILVMAATGGSAQWLIHKDRKKVSKHE